MSRLIYSKIKAICIRVSTIQWASRAEAVESVCKGFKVHEDTSEQLSDENYEA